MKSLKRFFAVLVAAFCLSALLFALPQTAGSAAAKTAPVTQKEEAAATLLARGMMCDVLAAVYDREGQAGLALAVNRADSRRWLFYFNQNEILLFGAPLSGRLYYFQDNDLTGRLSPAIFEACFFNDVRGQEDDRLGIWQGTDHLLTVYANFEIENGKVVVEMGPTSAAGVLKASHYQGRIRGEAHVRAVREFLALMPALHRAVKQAGIKIAKDYQQ